jgi:UDP-GlcNAc:undecaprenyl-phosphate GlcNAc-1-phosphate transferase
MMSTASSALVMIIVVGCCNAASVMDGLDGLCGGVTAIIAAGFLFVAMHLASTGSAMNSNLDGTRIVLAFALLGAVLGFVPFNFKPASIFMGDTGSMFLGFGCAVMIILMGQGQHPKWFLASMVIFALPVLDTTLAFVRRYLNGTPMFTADRHHFHHQLVARGFSEKQTVLISYGLALAFVLLGGLIVYLRTRFAGALYLVIFGSVLVAAFKMGMVHEKPVTAKPKSLNDDMPHHVANPEAATIIEILPSPQRTSSTRITRNKA